MKKDIPFPIKLTQLQHDKITAESKAVWLTKSWFMTMLIETYVRTDVIREDSVAATENIVVPAVKLKED